MADRDLNDSDVASTLAAGGFPTQSASRVALRRCGIWLLRALKVVGYIAILPAGIALMMAAVAVCQLVEMALIILAVVALPVGLCVWLWDHTGRDAARAIANGVKKTLALIAIHLGLLVVWLPVLATMLWMDRAYGFEWYLATFAAVVAWVFSMYATLRYMMLLAKLADWWDRRKAS